jgi:hypothetical protein
MRAALAAALYFAIVFVVGFLLRPIRVLWLEPTLGTTAAVACETPFLLGTMIVAARWTPRRLGLSLDSLLLVLMGIGALLLQQVADFALGIGLRRMSPLSNWRISRRLAGAIYAALLLVFATMPVLVNRR